MLYAIGILVVCMLCCTEIYGSIQCFECQHVQLPSDCTNLVTCQPNQQCYIEEVSTGYNLVHYNIGCRDTTQCFGSFSLPLIGKRSVSRRSHRLACTECCQDDFCNAHGCNSLKKECYRRLGIGYFYDSTSGECSNVVKVRSQTFNQSEAEDRCRADGAHLVSINSEEHQNELFSQIFTHFKNSTDFWIGLQADVAGSHQYTWSDSRNTTYTNWGYSMLSQPTDRLNKTENCVYIKSADHFNWYDEHCENRKTGFACELSAVNLENECRRNVIKGYFYNRQLHMCLRLVYSANATYNYTDAEKVCNQDNSTLLKVDTYQKMDFLIQWINVNQADGNDFWIGLKDRNDTSIFTWPDGTSVNYSRWGGPELPHPPNNQPDELFTHTFNQECVFLSPSSNGSWYDDRCDVIKYGHICQFKGNTDKETENGCYTLLSNGYTFDFRTKLCVTVMNSSGLKRNEAELDCQAYNSSLVEISSKSGSMFIHNLIYKSNANGTEFWIGGRDMYKNGTFYWENSGLPFNYTDWHRVQNQSAIKDCVIMDHGDQFRWYPEDCAARKQGYICGIDKQAIIQNTLNKYYRLHPTSAIQTTPATSLKTTTTTTITTTTTVPSTTTTSSKTTTTSISTTTTVQPSTTTTTLPSTTTTAQTTTIPTTISTIRTTTTVPTTTTTTSLTTTAMTQTTPPPTIKIKTPTMKTTSTSTLPTTTVSSTIGRTYGPNGYYDISTSTNSFCIKMYTQGYTFADAVRTCIKDKATLVFPTSALMMRDIKTYIDNHYRGISSFYIGVVSYEHNNLYTSIRRQSVGYTDWMKGEPIVGNFCVKANENALCKWQSTQCNVTMPFMCQKLQGC